ncbi:MAG: phage tail protein [Nannocystaceae bacterium]
MAAPETQRRADYPMVAYNFRVTVGAVTASFSEVSGLSREHETVTYRHGLSFREGEVITKFHLAKYAPITLRRGVFRGAAPLYAWLEGAGERPLTITLCDERGEGVIEWRVARALARKLEAPTFDASAGEVAVEALEVMAAGISVRELPRTPSPGGGP